MSAVPAYPTKGGSRLPTEVWILAAIAFCVAIGYGIVAPAVPGFARQFGVGRTLAALVVSMFAFARVVTAFGGGRLVDIFGARRVLGIGLVIVAVSSALAGLSATYTQLLLLRGAGGFGSAMFTVASASVLAARVPSAIRGQAMGVYSGGFLLGGIAGPVIGGPLTQADLRLPFYFYAGTLAVAAVIAFIALPRSDNLIRRTKKIDADPAVSTAVAEQTPTSPDADTPPMEGVREALMIRLYRAAVVANFAGSWALAIRVATIPLFVTEALAQKPSITGLGLAVYAAADGLALYPAGRLSDRWGRRPAMIIGALVTALSLSLLAFPPNLTLFYVAMVVGGVGAALQTVGPAAVAGDVAGGRRGSVIATFQISGDIGVMLGPLIANSIVDSSGYSLAFIVTAVVAASAAGFAAVAKERPTTGQPA